MTTTLTDVVTYQLAYLSSRQVTLCTACVDRDDHELGSLGPVQHGAHRGDCEGAAHSRTLVSRAVVEAR